MSARLTPRNVRLHFVPLRSCKWPSANVDRLDIESVSTELIEDNIVSVSRQMIDKEASVPSTQVVEEAANGVTNGVDGMAIDQDEEL